MFRKKERNYIFKAIMRTSTILAGLLALGIFFTGCVRKTTVNPPEVPPVAGKGGLTTIKITAQHREKNIDGAMIYVKYNATKAPDNMSSFDDSLEAKPTTVEFTTLKKGNYYFYAKGIDPDLGGDEVTGGTRFVIIDTLESTYDLVIAVRPN